MYFAKFENDRNEWLQGVSGLGSPEGRSEQAWWLAVSQWLEQAARIQGATLARRIAIDRDGRLRQSISIVAPAAVERDLRQIFAVLTSLERRAGGIVELPMTREEHDARLGVPALRLCTTAESFSVDGLPLACDFRISPVLDDLLIGAREGGYELTYQLHVRRIDPQPAWSRTARKNALAIAALAGASPALAEWQNTLARAISEAHALCEEYVAVGSGEAARAVSARLEEEFHARYAEYSFMPPPFQFRNGWYDESLQLGVHSHDLDPLSAVDLCGAGISTAGRHQLLYWRPSTRVMDLVTRDEALMTDDEGAEKAPAADGNIPEPCAAGPCVFISYKRQDMPRIAPTLRALAAAGIPIWYDRGIPGGVEWDAVIEDKLLACRCILLFVSSAAIASKYVRREVKFADALNTPVLSVLLEDTALRYGMRMLLTQYQILDSRSPDFAPRLKEALTRVGPSLA